jgi:transposase-like protein
MSQEYSIPIQKVIGKDWSWTEMSRRSFTTEYKRKIVDEAAASKDVKAILAREGLSPANLYTFKASLEHPRHAAVEPMARAADLSDVVVKRLDGLEAAVRQVGEPNKQLLEIQSKLDDIYALLKK